MNALVEFRFVEFRQDGRTLEGTAIRYGSEAEVLGFRERFQRAAFGDISALDVILNRQHDRARPLARTGGGGLELLDSEESLTIRAVLPQTRDADDVLALVEARILRGLSLEFRAQKEQWEGNLRTVRKALLTGIGVVDRPAYTDATTELAKRHQIGPAGPNKKKESRLWI